MPPRQRCHDSPTKRIPLSLWVTATVYYVLSALCGIIASLSSPTQSDPFRILSVAVVVGRGSPYHMPMFLNSPISPVRNKCTMQKSPLETAKTPTLPSCSDGRSTQCYECLGKRRAEFYKTNSYPLYDPLIPKYSDRNENKCPQNNLYKIGKPSSILQWENGLIIYDILVQWGKK